MSPGGVALAVACVLPCVVLYLLFIKGMDRYEPEPVWLLLMVFGWGAFGATALGAIGGAVGHEAVTAMLHADGSEQVVAAATATFVVPVVEETAKAFGLVLVWLLSVGGLRELDGALDGVIYGGAIGLGFTLTEDVVYLASAMDAAGGGSFGVVFLLRTVLSGLGHASFTAVAGLGFGIAAESRSRWLQVAAPLFGLAGAIALHGFHNLLVTFLLAGGLGLLAKLLFFWVFDVLFFLLAVFLVARDRWLVWTGLQGEVGGLVSADELADTTSWWMFVPLWNRLTLARGPGGFAASRAKQLAMVELAFLKHRRWRGEVGLEAAEADLRRQIEAAAGAGVRASRA